MTYTPQLSDVEAMRALRTVVRVRIDYRRTIIATLTTIALALGIAGVFLFDLYAHGFYSVMWSVTLHAPAGVPFPMLVWLWFLLTSPIFAVAALLYATWTGIKG